MDMLVVIVVGVLGESARFGIVSVHVCMDMRGCKRVCACLCSDECMLMLFR